MEDVLGPLLRALSESLDVREIFARISTEAHRVVPHDFLALGMLSEDRTRVRTIALSGELPETSHQVALSGALRAAIEQGAYAFRGGTLSADGKKINGQIRPEGSGGFVPIEIDAQPMFLEFLKRGFVSYLRVPVPLHGGLAGGLVFCSRDANPYEPVDLVRAKQIASVVALTLAHQRLAEEEQKSAEARARAGRLEARVEALTEELASSGRHRALGRSKRWRDVLEQATKVASTEATVLVTGESGTGKEVVARFIHRSSPRADGPYVALNCAALPEQLLESELFGHEKGAFTGALTSRAGKIEQAAAGVLFLDEVGEMSREVQAKFLRVLQEREFQRVGGGRTLRADVRVLAATNRDLKAAISQGAFREDLYYRLAVFEIVLPPLRERPEDIPVLAEAFMDEIGRSIGRPAAGISDEARDRLNTYRWPGNVRELRNAIERALILCEGGQLRREHLPHDIGVEAKPAPSETLGSTERAMIVEALTRAGNNKSKAARLLGLTRAQLRSRLERHGIEASD
jgi:transcriptional regulator with GAF, ATPase, and Fis domain